MYNIQEIEKKWQKYWEENKTFKVENDFSKPKYYCLDMFPFPSGAGLHVGHPEGMTANDIVSRYKNAKGFNVLHPIGWDAFGLPAENYAIKNGTHPKITTKQNIDNFRKQIKSLGFSYDWNREVDTTDPEYYKWTQWIFLKMFEKGLAYEQDLPINYCPSCKTGLANEEVLNDFSCERCRETVVKKKVRQWVLAITKYADRLLTDIDKLDWPEGLKEMQRNWIGKSEGCEFELKLAKNKTQKNEDYLPVKGDLNGQAKSSYASSIGEITKKVKKKEYKLYLENNISISVYTTRIDTVFGMTYAVLAPDHKDVQNFITDENKEICEKYITDSSKKSDQDRTQADKEKTGVFTGSYVINPFNGKEVPLWIGDYVLGNYGTGAVMAVPAHDERDFEFAKKYDLEIIESISGGEISEKAFTGLGILTNSGDFSGLESIEAQSKMIEFAEKNGFGSKKINYKLRDWLFSRQRYWGDPIPLIHLENDNIEKLDKIKDKKNKDYHIPQEGVTHNGDTAKSLYVHIILENITKVKKKRNKIHFFKLNSIVKTKKGDIIFDGQSLQEHFYLKNIKEQKRRKEFGTTIIENLNNIQYESELLGYINIGNKIFRIILEKIENKYNVKTYYLVQKYTKIFNKAYIKEKNDGNYLMIKGQEFSKIYDGIYGKIVGDNNLPIKLPEVEKFEPSGDGQSPLANVESFVNIQLADNLVGKRETNTMPQWGGSCWYYLRYMNPDNKDMLVDPEVEKYWGQVDSYVGGAEHAVLHLLYARFWHKFLFDIGVVSNDEPFYRLRNQGLITAHSFEDSKGKLIAYDFIVNNEGELILDIAGELIEKNNLSDKNEKYFHKETGEKLKMVIAKMSKSLKNVVNPDKIVAEYGADTLRLYEMYMADFKDSAPWDTKNIIGVKRFLEKVERAFNSIEGKFAENDKEAIKILNKTIRKVEEDIENYKFNTAIAQMMILVNYGRPTDEKLFIEWKEKFVVILSAFAPFLAEELYSELCRDVSLKHLNKINKKDLSEKGLYKYNSVFFAKWPEVDESLLIESTVKIAVQVLGKVRGTIEINKDESKESVLEKARNNSDVAKWLEGKNLVKEIYVPGKIVNLVVN